MKKRGYDSEHIPRSHYKYILMIIVLVFILYALGARVYAQSNPNPPKVFNNQRRVLYARDNGVASDSSDVTTNFQTLLSNSRGATIILDTNGVYYVTDSLQIPEYCEIYMRGSKIHVEGTGAISPIVMLSNSKISGGIIDVDTSTADYSGNSNYGAGVRVGEYAYNGTINEYRNIILEDMTVSTERVGGAAIVGLGEVNGLILRNCHIPSTDSMGMGIELHWGLDTTDAENAELTYIPKNILIDNCQIDSMDRATADGIYISGCLNVSIDNCIIESPYRGIVSYGGDIGLFRADPAYLSDTSNLWGTGISIRNTRITDASSQGVKIDGSSSDFVDSTYTSKPYPVLIENCNIVGNGAANTGYGVTFENCSDGTVRNCDISGFQNGVANGINAYRIKVRDNRIHHNNRHGIYLSYSLPHQPDGWIIDGNWIYMNDAEADTGALTAGYDGLYMHSCGRTFVTNNIFGDAAGTETQRYSWSQTSSCGFTVFMNNYTRAVDTGAYRVRPGYHTAINNNVAGGITQWPDGAPNFYEDSTVNPFDLTSDAPTDGYYLTFHEADSTFDWVAGTGGTASDVDTTGTQIAAALADRVTTTDWAAFDTNYTSLTAGGVTIDDDSCVLSEGEASDTYETITNVGKIGDDTTTWNTAVTTLGKVTDDTTTWKAVAAAFDTAYEKVSADYVLGNDSVVTGGSASGTLTLSGATSGSASISVQDVAGTPPTIYLPTAAAGGDNYILTDTSNGNGYCAWAAAGAGAGTVTDQILTDSLDSYLDTASIHDSLDVVRGEAVSDANLTDSLDHYFDTTALADWLDTVTAVTVPLADSATNIDTTGAGFTTYVTNHAGGGSGTVTDQILTDTLDSYLDTAAIHDSLDVVRGESVTDANLTDTLDSYLDTASIHDSLEVLRGEYGKIGDDTTTWNGVAAAFDTAYEALSADHLTAGDSLTVGSSGSGSIALSGSTSGSATVSVQDEAGAVTIYLPNAQAGGDNYVLADTSNGSGYTAWVAGGTGTVTDQILTDTLDSYIDSASIHDSLDVVRGEAVTDANLTDTLDSYLDTAAIKDSLDVIRGEAVSDANLTDTLDSYLDTASIKDSLDVLRGEAVTDANLTDTLDSYLDTASIHDSLANYVLAAAFADSADHHMDSAEVMTIFRDSTIHWKQITIVNPDAVQDSSDAVPILNVNAAMFPHGITIVGCGIATDQSSTYAVNFEEWETPSGGSVSDIETGITTSTSTEDEDDGTIDNPTIEAGNYVFADLETDHVKWLNIWIAFMVNGS